MRITWGPIAFISLLLTTVAFGELDSRYDKFAQRTEVSTAIGPIGFRAFHNGQPGAATAAARCWLLADADRGAFNVIFLINEGLPTESRAPLLLNANFDLEKIAKLATGQSLAFAIYTRDDHLLEEYTLTPADLTDLRNLVRSASPAPTTAPSTK